MAMLIEGMKNTKLLEKRMQRTADEIQQYASLMSNEKPKFETEAEQREKVTSLVQSLEDLAALHLETKRNVDYTNMVTVVEINGKRHTISQWLQIRMKIGNLLKRGYEALNEHAAESSMIRRGYGDKTEVSVIRLYDEAEKLRKISDITTTLEEIDGRLEVVNATTELLEAPAV